ncbi:hypothetical protein H2203_003922 [Taxawa tesnikishii (nom. ined.)]|nr:hypothetical protein H2203_003922 [Dothideales sp. JES 119]
MAVVVLASANQDFWINHLDLRVVSSRHPLPSPSPEPSALRLLGAIINALDTLPIIFISEIDGRAIGGGNELAVHTDLRYLGPSALFGIPEVAGGLVHGGVCIA